MPLTTTESYRADLLAARPSQMVVMLYDNALASLRSAIVAIEGGDIESRCNSVNTASEITTTLLLALDHEQGGEVAERLESIYRFMIGRMMFINLHNDADIARSVIDLLMPLRDAWLEVDRIVADGADSSQIEPTMLEAAKALDDRLAVSSAA